MANCLYMFWLRKFSCSWLMMAKKMNNAMTLELGMLSLMTLWSLLSKLHVQLVTYIWWFVLTGSGIKSLYLTREFCLNLCKNRSWTRHSSQMGQSLLTTKRGSWNQCYYCLGHTHPEPWSRQPWEYSLEPLIKTQKWNSFCSYSHLLCYFL
jgi:hypothetical protein